MQTFKPVLFAFALALVLACVLSGCASQQKELLAKDYLNMTNEELLAHYDNLESEIARCRTEPPRTSVGIGTGFGLRSLGLFLGLSQGVGRCNPDELTKRRREVLAEMKRRGLEA
ncbi:MAG TPA: hypothetical protein PKM41_03360 [Deltaproteobacteria bacterium]|jgi:outer membrane murein-binding lipoprotein Lpp|nr:hypothetical protein [Deltaproteobacteria bacterium]HOI06461.1 hypothetical protein [Deltaproteobacteria bacterium]